MLRPRLGCGQSVLSEFVTKRRVHCEVNGAFNSFFDTIIESLRFSGNGSFHIKEY